MPAMTPRNKALRQLAADPRAQATMRAQAGPVPDDVSAWLAGLQTLAGVPFAYLVPDARMLPPESIRFFAVDPNWTTALTDGALSLAAKTAPAAAAVQALRPAALAATAAPAVYSGFLLRSAAVADWPGLRVSGYAGQTAAPPALPIVRLERLAPTVLLALFAGLIQRVELTEPAQHLHFGVISASGLQVWLRWIDQANAGGQVTATQGGQVTPTQGTVTLRQDSARAVVDVTTTVAAPMRHRCAISANGIAASPTTRVAIHHPTCRMTERVTRRSGRATISVPCSTRSRSTRRISSDCRWADLRRCILALPIRTAPVAGDCRMRLWRGPR